MKRLLFVLFVVALNACDEQGRISESDIRHLKIIAHRGVSLNFPENSTKSLLEAVRAEADAVEFDVQLSKDSELIVFHDDHLMRMAGREGRIAHYTADELKTFRLKNKNGEFTEETIPTLREVLDSIAHKIDIFIEIKPNLPGIEQKLMDMITEYELDYSVRILSFSIESLRRIYAINQKIPLSLLVYDKEVSPLNSSLRSDINYIDNVAIYYGLVNFETLAGLKGLVKEVYVYTLNTPGALPAQDYELIDGIITDEPVMWSNLKKQK